MISTVFMADISSSHSNRASSFILVSPAAFKKKEISCFGKISHEISLMRMKYVTVSPGHQRIEQKDAKGKQLPHYYVPK